MLVLLQHVSANNSSHPQGKCSHKEVQCSFVKYTSFVLHWIYDPTRIKEKYLLLDVWMQKNTNKN
jgi:hypothetical protein